MDYCWVYFTSFIIFHGQIYHPIFEPSRPAHFGFVAMACCAVQGEDLRAHSDDEEAAARKLEESRRRRAAMMTQADSMTEHRSRNDTKHVENMNSIIHMTHMTYDMMVYMICI